MQQFYDTYTPRSLHNHVAGYWDHNNQYLQQQWDIARWVVTPLLNIHLPKNKGFKTPQDLAKFPWDQTPVKPPPPNLSKKEEREKLKQTFNK